MKIKGIGKMNAAMPYAVNPHVWSDDGKNESTRATRRGFLLYNEVKVFVLGCVVLLAMLTSAGGGSPEYEVVDYLSFPKGAYIDTGIAVTNTDIALRYSADAGNHDLFGCANGTYQSTYIGQENGKWRIGGDVDRVDRGTVTAGEHEILYTEWVTIIDGERYGTGAQYAGRTPSSLLIGKYHRSNDFVGRIYSFSVTNRSTKAAIIDLVPAVRLSDLAAGFYDRARDVFLTNAGTGKFGMPMLSAYEPVKKVSFQRGDYVDIGEPVAKVDIAMKYRAEASQMDVFGSMWAKYDSLYLFQGTSTWTIGSSGTIGVGGVSTGVHEVFYGANYKVVIDGVSHDASTATASTSTYNLLIGKGYREVCFVGDVYSFAVTNYDTKVAVVDLVPCRRRISGEVGFFDRSSGRFFGNAHGIPFGIYVSQEKIHFPGSCALDTGKPVSAATVEMRYSAGTENYDLFGCTNTAWLSCYLGQRGGHWIAGGNIQTYDNLGTVTEGEHTIKYEDWHLYVDGTRYDTGAQYGMNTKGSNLLLGRYYRGNFLRGDVYSFKVREGGATVLDLLPCYRASDRKYGFYDTVSNAFLTDAGLGCAPQPGCVLIIK